MPTTKISKKYQIVVPKEIRKTMKLKSGEIISIQLIDTKRAIITTQPEDPVKALEGLGEDVWKKLGGGTKYLKEERKSWQKR